MRTEERREEGKEERGMKRKRGLNPETDRQSFEEGVGGGDQSERRIKQEARKREAWMERWKSCGERRITLRG